MPRFIAMKNFRSKIANRRAQDEGGTIPLGQVVGQVIEVEEKTGTLPDGGVKKSWVAHGEFQSVNYETGEVLEAGSIYLPKYFAEQIERSMRLGKANGVGGSVTFGIEIGTRFVGEDASIPFAYEVSNLLGRAPSSPIEQMKRELAKLNLLRLPAPQAMPAAIPAPTAAALAAPTNEATGDEADPGDEFAEGETHAKGKKPAKPLHTKAA